MLNLEHSEEMAGKLALQFNLREYSSNAVILHMDPVVGNLLGDLKECEVPSFIGSERLSSYFGSFLRILRDTFTQVCVFVLNVSFGVYQTLV